MFFIFCVLSQFDICFFSSHIVRSHEEESRTSLRILLQHLCVGVPDRAEYRKLVAEVRKIISICVDRAEYRKLVAGIIGKIMQLSDRD